MVVGGVHFTEEYARLRIKEPKLFKKTSFRTHDIGRRGHTKRIAGRLKSTGKWETQAMLIPREEYSPALARKYLKKYKLKRA